MTSPVTSGYHAAVLTAARARLLALLLLASHTALAVSFALHASPNWDEIPTFGQGRRLLLTGRWDFPGCINHPPLPWYLQSLPLLFLDLEEGQAWSLRQPPDDPSLHLLWRGVYDPLRGQMLYHTNSRGFAEDRLMVLVRLPTLAFSLLGALLLWRWARSLHGEWGGLLALALWTLSPSFIAHSVMATTDMAFTAFTLATSFTAWRWWERPGARRALLCGLCWGLACLSKYTGLLLLGPLGLALLFGVWRLPPAARRERLIASARFLGIVVGLGALVIAAGYRGQFWIWIEGVRYQQLNLRHGQLGMMLGRVSNNGWWYFYPFVAAVKTPTGELGLAAIGAWLWLRRERLSTPLVFATLTPLFLFVFFLFKRLPVGLRHILPCYPAAMLAAGALLAWAPGIRLPRWRGLVAGGLLALDLAELAHNHPHEISYFNLPAGGWRNGWKLLADSSVDWGQDLRDLRDWMRARGIERIQLGYFGNADPAAYGLAYDALPSLHLRNRGSGPRSWPPRGLIAVSSSCYWGLCPGGPQFEGRNPYAFLHGTKPVELIGGSILIFELP